MNYYKNILSGYKKTHQPGDMLLITNRMMKSNSTNTANPNRNINRFSRGILSWLGGNCCPLGIGSEYAFRTLMIKAIENNNFFISVSFSI